MKVLILCNEGFSPTRIKNRPAHVELVVLNVPKKSESPIWNRMGYVVSKHIISGQLQGIIVISPEWLWFIRKYNLFCYGMGTHNYLASLALFNELSKKETVLSCSHTRNERQYKYKMVVCQLYFADKGFSMLQPWIPPQPSLSVTATPQNMQIDPLVVDDKDDPRVASWLFFCSHPDKPSLIACGRTFDGKRVIHSVGQEKLPKGIYVSFVRPGNIKVSSATLMGVPVKHDSIYKAIKKVAIQFENNDDSKWFFSDVADEESKLQFSSTWIIPRSELGSGYLKNQINEVCRDKEWDYRVTNMEFWNTLDFSVENMIGADMRMGHLTPEKKYTVSYLIVVAVGVNSHYFCLADNQGKVFRTGEFDVNDEIIYDSVKLLDPDIIVCLGVQRSINEGVLSLTELNSFSLGGGNFKRAIVHSDIKRGQGLHIVDIRELVFHSELIKGTLLSLDTVESIMKIMTERLMEIDSEHKISEFHYGEMRELGLCSLGDSLFQFERFTRIYRNSLSMDKSKRISEWMISPPRSLYYKRHNTQPDSAEREGGMVIYDNSDSGITFYENVFTYDYNSHYGRIIANIKNGINPDNRGQLGKYIGSQITKREALPESDKVERNVLKNSYNIISGCIWEFFPLLARRMTKKGRELLFLIRDTVQNSGLPCSIVYADTDGMMISIKDNERCEELAKRLESLLSNAISNATDSHSKISLRECYSRFTHVKGKMYFALELKGEKFVCSSMTHKSRIFPVTFERLVNRVLSDFIRHETVDSGLKYASGVLTEIKESFNNIEELDRMLTGFVCKITRKNDSPWSEKTPQFVELMTRMIFRQEPIPDIKQMCEYIHCVNKEDNKKFWETKAFIIKHRKLACVDWEYYLVHFFYNPLLNALEKRVPGIKKSLESVVDHVTNVYFTFFTEQMELKRIL